MNNWVRRCVLIAAVLVAAAGSWFGHREYVRMLVRDEIDRLMSLPAEDMVFEFEDTFIGTDLAPPVDEVPDPPAEEQVSSLTERTVP